MLLHHHQLEQVYQLLEQKKSYNDIAIYGFNSVGYTS